MFLKMFCKWILVALVVGIIGGLVGSAFHLSVGYVTELRMAHPKLLFLMPLCGIIIVFIYKITKTEGKGTNAIIGSVHFGEKVPILLVPVIFIATALTHLCGGSAGREGAALQIGGGLGCNIGKLLRLNEKEAPIAVLCGMAAVFSALFGTPVAATVFALEVCSVGLIHYSGLVPCSTAAFVAYGITRIFGIAPTRFAVEAMALSTTGVLKVIILAFFCAMVSVLFCELLHHSERLTGKYFPNAYVRILVGSGIVIVLTFLVGNMDYNGAGMPIIIKAVEQGQVRPEAFIMKILFTAITLSFGFKGGEVVPTLFIGATLGCAAAPLLGLPAGFAAALGMAGLFCGAVNCPLGSLILSIELFGAAGFPYFAVVCFISYMLSGYTSLYKEQIITYSKLRAEFINIHAE